MFISQQQTKSGAGGVFDVLKSLEVLFRETIYNQSVTILLTERFGPRSQNPLHGQTFADLKICFLHKL